MLNGHWSTSERKKVLEATWILELGIPRMGYQRHHLLTRFGATYFIFMDLNFLIIY